mmetsp:Transcript_21687/g.68499  ORF Transcript_21687/g.68499 Transcript_21687/m.68499 type:complete len:96 (+) Transcript_21687:726-1013(+)
MGSGVLAAGLVAVLEAALVAVAEVDSAAAAVVLGTSLPAAVVAPAVVLGMCSVASPPAAHCGQPVHCDCRRRDAKMAAPLKEQPCKGSALAPSSS